MAGIACIFFTGSSTASGNCSTRDEQRAAKIALSTLVQEVRALESTQLLTLSQVTPKADLGFMLITPDLQVANRIEKQLTLSLGADVLMPVYSYLSLTEESEYTTTDEQYAANARDRTETAARDAGVRDGDAGLSRAHAKIPARARLSDTARLAGGLFLQHDANDAANSSNWYALPFEERRVLMGGHARVGRQYAGKVKQLITGSTGLDDAEWGVTLFAHDTFQIKAIVYQMRFDEVSAAYADFGEFYIGIQLPLDELFRRLQL